MSGMTLQALSDALKAQLTNLGLAEKAIIPIQQAYVAHYSELEQRYQASIGPCVDQIVAAWEEVGPALFAPISARLVEEQAAIARRRAELRDHLLPAHQQEADSILARSQQVRAAHHAANVREKKREADLETQVQALEAELETLNAQIKAKAGCLGVFWRFFTVRKLIGQRKRVLKDLGALQAKLREVREGWKEAAALAAGRRSEAQAKLQTLLLERAQFQGELEPLDDDIQRELLARQRAVHYVLDSLRAPVACPLPEAAAAVAALAALNAEREVYQAGLVKASHLLGLFAGVEKGVTAFNESVGRLQQQEKQYSAYLPKLQITLPRVATELFYEFPTIAKTFQQTAQFVANPMAFIPQAQQFIDRLSDQRIKDTFEGLGNALNAATKSQWK